MDTLRQWMNHFAGTFWKLPYLWNGRTVWKNMGQDHGVAYIYYHPDGGYFVGTRLIAPLEGDWSGTLAWMQEHPLNFGPLHIPWRNDHPSVFICTSLCERLYLKSQYLTKELEARTAEVKDLEDKLEESRQQLEVATSMLQAEWDPMQVESGPASSSGDYVFVHPTAKAAAKAKSMPEAPPQVTWIHLCSLYMNA